jgi:repressor LexA
MTRKKDENLSPSQRKVFDFIKQFWMEQGLPPTVREIAAHFSFGINNAQQYLKLLIRKGYIRRTSSVKARSLELLKEKWGRPEDYENAVNIPIIGRIAAGQPIYAEENFDGVLTIDKRLAKGRKLFALKVQGDSMIKAGIFNGDYVIVRGQNVADNGDIAVALIGDAATVKKYYYREGKVILRPENDKLKDMIFEPDEVLIQGKVVGVQRIMQG